MDDYGYGSIYRRSVDGRWFAAVEVRGTPRAARRRVTFSGSSREAVEAKLAAYREEHPSRLLGKPRTRKAHMEAAKALGDHTEREWCAKVRRLGTLCIYCQRKCGKFGPTKDHLVPVSRGGSNGLDNCVPCCKQCNSLKGDLTVEEFLEMEAVWVRGFGREAVQAIRVRLADAT